MKELLAAAKNLHHILILLCFALVPFALLPDEVGRLRRAAAEVDILRHLPRAQFTALVDEQRRSVRIILWQRIAYALPQARRGLTALQWSGKIPVITPLPGRDDSVEAWKKALRRELDFLGHEVLPKETDHLRFLVPDKKWDANLQPVIQTLASTPANEVKSVNFVEIEVSAEVPEVFIAKEMSQEHGAVLRGVPQTLVGSATVHVAIKDPMDFDIGLGPTKSTVPRETDATPWKGALVLEQTALVEPKDFLSKDDEMVLYETFMELKFPLPWTSRYYWEDVRALSPQKAYDWFRAQIKAQTGELPIGTIKVPLSQYGLAAQLTLILMLSYVGLHTRQALGRIPTLPQDDTGLQSTAWAAMFEGVLATIFVLITLWLLPVWVTYLLNQRPVLPSSAEVFTGRVAMAAVAVAGGWTSVLVLRLKRFRAALMAK